MKKFTFIIFIVTLFSLAIFAQDTESYTALKVTGDNVPVIDGTIDALWDNVEIVPLEKVPEIGGVVHTNITVPDPTEDDFYAEFGMVWNEDGMYFLFRVVDDVIVIFEDYNTSNSTPARQHAGGPRPSALHRQPPGAGEHGRNVVAPLNLGGITEG